MYWCVIFGPSAYEKLLNRSRKHPESAASLELFPVLVNRRLLIGHYYNNNFTGVMPRSNNCNRYQTFMELQATNTCFMSPVC
jgi:hypothetical protein